ncbi:hypothetical protein V8E54_014420 [Elaphomyces granulatus]
MEADSNYVFSRCQIHRHTFTCFKYGKRKLATNKPDDSNGTSRWDSSEGERSAKRVNPSNNLHCRFLFPKKLQDFGVDEKTGAITLRPWVNKGNKILPCTLRSNHDISVIANSSHMLASLYYMAIPQRMTTSICKSALGKEPNITTT